MDWSLIVSGFSLIIAIISSYLSIRVQKIANLISAGEIEKSIRDLISQARRNMEDRSLYFMKLRMELRHETMVREDRENLMNNAIEVAIRTYKSAVEDWLNAYEEACAKYLDGKIDKERFYKTYRHEIKNIVEVNKDNEEMYSLIHPEGTSHYKAIWKVYKNWEPKE
jgi:hypothetical protein